MSKNNLSIQELYDLSLKSGEKKCKKTIAEIRSAMKKAAEKGDLALPFFLDQERLMYVSHWADKEKIIFQVEQDSLKVGDVDLILCIITWGHAPQILTEEDKLPNRKVGFN